MVLNMLAAFLIALLSGLGIGGGGLFAVYLALLSDIPQIAVQGINLLFFLFSSLSSVTLQLLKRRIMLYAVGLMVASGIIGVLIGTLLSGLVSGELLRISFGIMLVSGGVISLRNSIMNERSKKCSSNTDKTREACPQNDTRGAE